MNGYLIFDYDLLANALILHEINHVSEESEAVVQWWYNQKVQSVMDENAETFYDFTHYLNAVKDAKLKNPPPQEPFFYLQPGQQLPGFQRSVPGLLHSLKNLYFMMIQSIIRSD